MALRMFNSLLPYFGNKRKLCPVIFKLISKYYARNNWFNMTFVDAFMGSGAVSLFAKAQGFRVISNDIAERSYIAGKALIENNRTKIDRTDIDVLFRPHPENQHTIEEKYVPEVFLEKHARFLDTAFLNADTYLKKYLLIKYIFTLRPYSKFSSPNAFNRPMADGRYDEIKATYNKHIKDNLKAPLTILRDEMKRINTGIFSNGHDNEVHKKDVFDFIQKVRGDVLYLDPPYAGTLSYEGEYGVLDDILGDARPKSAFSGKDGMHMLDSILSGSGNFPLWIISFGNAGGRNSLGDLVSRSKAGMAIIRIRYLPQLQRLNPWPKIIQ
jgi:adenine-specific DNA-methyltransferase